MHPALLPIDDQLHVKPAFTDVSLRQPPAAANRHPRTPFLPHLWRARERREEATPSPQDLPRRNPDSDPTAEPLPSITMSLDRDLKRLRLEKYTPAAANEAREWIEGILGQRLSGDFLESLKDGVALCK